MARGRRRGGGSALLLAVAAVAMVGILGDSALARAGGERLVQQIIELRPDLATVALQAEAACGTSDAIRIARAVQSAAPLALKLQPVAHLDTDTIRWAKTLPSLALDLTGEHPVIRLDRFGRKVRVELETALSRIGPAPFEIDLSDNTGGDVEWMLQVAERLCGRAGLAVETRFVAGDQQLEPIVCDRARVALSSVRVGPVTASAGRLLANLLAAGGARVGGEQSTAPTIPRKAVLAVDNDWRMVLVIGEMQAADTGMSTGPDPRPASPLATIATR